MKTKIHMRNPEDTNTRTRCGGSTKTHITMKYGSPQATCKKCHELYNKDLKKIMEE